MIDKKILSLIKEYETERAEYEKIKKDCEQLIQEWEVIFEAEQKKIDGMCDDLYKEELKNVN